jgi:hypothetical protein
VTRSGEFFPIWWLFTLIIFLKIQKATHIFVPLFSTFKVI